MTTITFFDTETTGLPDWKTPSGGENQPHIVELSAIQCDIETQEIVREIHAIVKPQGWKISDEMTKIHGISHKKALEVGISEVIAVNDLLTLCSDSLRCCHNRTFDQRIIRIALKRYDDFNEKDAAKWAGKDDFYCTMMAANKIMKLGKYPNLTETYKFFTEKELGGDAHSAIHDTKACMEVYFAIRELEKE